MGDALIKVDTLVVGAGVVGLAIARSIATQGRSVVLVEKHGGFGRELSSRNSEVIHAGLYDEPGSLKASLCVRGRQLLIPYLASRKVPFRQPGKLVVATEYEQVPGLLALEERARNNGVTDLQLWDAAKAVKEEPALRCLQAIYSPSTGILDTHRYMESLEREAQDQGAVISYRTPFLRARYEQTGFISDVGGREPTQIRSRVFVNAAGLGALAVAGRVDAMSTEHMPRVWLAKGSYFSIRDPIPFSRLIYPMPDRGGLGIHLSWDLTRRGRAGPDVEWIEQVDFGVEEARSSTFEKSIRAYWPGLSEEALAPDFASIRPKLHGPQQTSADFLVQAEDVHGVPGLINLFGIESPGLTASLALAELVAAAA